MDNKNEDASDGSVQEIAVNHENPISTEPSLHPKSGYGSAVPSAPFEGIPISACARPTDQTEDPALWEQVDEGETPFGKDRLRHPRKLVTADTFVDKIVKLPLENLLAHPQNKLLFGPTSPNQVEKLAESIAETRQLSPLVVTADLGKIGYYVILSGHKRADALRSLNRTEADCRVVDVQDADERLLYLVEANRQQVPTTEQKIRIGEVHFGLETRKAKARQVAGAKAKKGDEAVETLTQPDLKPSKAGDDASGKARDIAAAKVGMSGVSFDKGRKVLQAMEKAQDDGKKETAAELLQLLNEKGVEPALARARVLNLIEAATRKTGGAGSKTQGTGVVAQSVDLIPMHAAVVPPKNSPSPASTVQIIDVRGINTVAKSGESSPPVPVQGQKQAQTEGNTVQPPGVRASVLGKKFIEALEALEGADLTPSQRWNLNQVFNAVSEWFGNHEKTLKPAGQV